MPGVKLTYPLHQQMQESRDVDALEVVGGCRYKAVRV